MDWRVCSFKKHRRSAAKQFEEALVKRFGAIGESTAKQSGADEGSKTQRHERLTRTGITRSNRCFFDHNCFFDLCGRVFGLGFQDVDFKRVLRIPAGVGELWT